MIKLMEFLGKTNPLGKQYRGLVVDNEDPEKLQRVKVIIDGLYNGPVEFLPWVYPKNPPGLGTRSDVGSMTPPVKNTELVIEFPTQDIYSGFYTGTWQSADTHPGAFDEDYPHSYGFTDDVGNQFRVNKAKGFSEWKASSGARLRFEKDSTVEVRTRKKIRFVSEDGKTEFSLNLETGEVNLTPKEKVTIGGNEGLINPVNLKIETGTAEETVSGGKTTKVLSGQKVIVGGPSSESIVGAKGVTIGGSYTKLIGGQVSESYATGIDQTVALGNYLTELLLGNRTVSILIGNYKVEIKAGSYDVDVLAGNVNIKTKAGSLELGNLLGKVSVGLAGDIVINATTTLDMKALVSATLEGTVKCDVKGAIVTVSGDALAKIKAPIIMLGNGTAPILTMATSPLVDLITGVPSIGVPTILAG